jgi:hypothetical protein
MWQERKVGQKIKGRKERMKLTKTELTRLVEEVMEEAHSKADEEKLKKISKQLKGSAKMHGEQAEDIDDIVDRSDDEELKESFDNYPGARVGSGGQAHRHPASHSKPVEPRKHPKCPSDWEGCKNKNLWCHGKTGEYVGNAKTNLDYTGRPMGSHMTSFWGDNTPCYKLMPKNEEIKEGVNCGCGNTPCNTYGKVSREQLSVMIREEYDALLDEKKKKRKKKKKKACKPAKGKRFAKRVNGKCRSYGQAGKAKGGGDRIRPGTKKGDAYCARSAKIKKCKNPPCANDLSRKKWKCRGSKSMK